MPNARINRQRIPVKGDPALMDGYSFVKDSYADFVTSLSSTGCALEDLGHCSDGSTHMWGMSYGDASKPYIYIQGAIHGAEWQGAYAVREFMTRLAKPPARNAQAINLLLKNFCFYAIPIVNPYGYINDTRGNATAVSGEYIDINRNFDAGWTAYDDSVDAPLCKGASAASEAETQAVVAKVQALDPVMYLDMHVWGTGNKGVYILPYRGSDADDFWDRVYNQVRFIDIPNGVSYDTLRPCGNVWARSNVSSKGYKCFAASVEVSQDYTNVEYSRMQLNVIMQASLTLHHYIYGSNTLTIQSATSNSNADVYDGQISAGAATTNYGNSSTWGVGNATGVRRGLLKFDLTKYIPLGAVVDSAIVTAEVASETSTTDYAVEFHKALVQWYEGLQAAGTPGAGEDASVWNYRNYNGSVGWGAAGGLADTDYAASATASTTITAPGVFTWDVTVDVQAWVNGGANYGWFLINADEATTTTRKLFNSNEQSGTVTRPKIVVTWHMPV